MQRLVYLSLLLMSTSLFWWVGLSEAACTPGTDCYCDKVKGGSLNDPLLLICEDFEAPTLRLNQGVGNGAPYYGPWYDDTGSSGDRGHNSYWNQKYGNSDAGIDWVSGQPSSPTFGTPCTAFAQCTGMKTWDDTNRWSANAYTPKVAIYDSTADYTAENAALTAPSHAAGGGSGVFDGNANLVNRIPVGSTHGITGFKSFSTTRTIGYTAAIAYPLNSDSSGIWGTAGVPASWKHNEWATVYTPNGGFDGLFIFYNQDGPRNGRPFAGFFGSFQDHVCKAGSIIATLGRASCSSDQTIMIWNSPANYSQPTDWPWGTWGCVRGLMENAGLSNQRMRIWFQGPNMTSERPIIDVTIDGTTLDSKNGYNGMYWNAYANTNQGGGYVASTALTFRYEDNVHVRAGTPVSCAQIGFSSGTNDITPPAAPTGITISAVPQPIQRVYVQGK